MSLDRVIAEQQKRIDDLTEGNKKLIERSARVFRQNEELFEAFARLLDADIPEVPTEQQWTSFNSLRHECRMQMLDAGYCLRCYNFVCECDDE
jgi:hypothetical protein